MISELFANSETSQGSPNGKFLIKLFGKKFSSALPDYATLA